jgi:hypothetical protein
MKPLVSRLVDTLLSAELPRGEDLIRGLVTEVVVPLEMYDDASRLAKNYQIR